ncbi:MAG: molecular chaperone DnaJ [Alphaproteobacteria bacterium]|nr:molecular chaperone DnaJ [Alphaproteobacteria bacterium]
MSEKDYYELLEVNKNASADEIKRSFRKLAMKYHPDRNPDDKEAELKFKEINEAYEVLKDDQKRAAYDRYGHQAFQNGGMGGGNPFGGGFGFNAEDLSDLFSNVFNDFMGGGMRSNAKNGPRRGEDLSYGLEISLEEAFTGVEKEIKVQTTDVCEKCSGFGTADGKEPPVCDMCHGSGKVRTQQGGFFVFETVCPKCRGQGRVVKDKCTECKGEGNIRVEKDLKIKIPAGVEDNTRMRITGAGKAGKNGGPKGDLYIFINIKEHKLYERSGKDLYTSVPVSMACAALGGKVEIPGIDGQKVEVKISSGAQTGDKLRIKNEGMSILNSDRRGDLFVLLKVVTPTNLNTRQKELLEEFRAISGDDDCQPEIKTFLDKIKDLFK